MSSDMQLKKHVEDELSWEPGVNAAAIGVAVKDAVVTLTGHVPSFAEKRTAEQAFCAFMVSERWRTNWK